MKDPGTPGLPPGGGTRLFMAAFLALGGIAVGVYAFASRGHAVNHGAKVAVTIVGVLLPLLFLGLAYALFRMVFPPTARGVALTVSASDVRRGTEVEARLEIANPDRARDTLELGLVCTEYYDIQTSNGKGGTQRTTSQAAAHEDWRPQEAAPLQTVRFTVPADAPFSYRGDCISFVWRVSVRQPRKLRFDRAVNVPIVVRP
jgi:hypothetical protein